MKKSVISFIAVMLVIIFLGVTAVTGVYSGLDHAVPGYGGIGYHGYNGYCRRYGYGG